MDPHINPEEAGLSKDSSKDGDGVNYLRRLKEPVAEGGPGSAARGNGKTAAVTAGPGFKDRRQSPRLRCSGSVEFRT